MRKFKLTSKNFLTLIRFITTIITNNLHKLLSKSIIPYKAIQTAIIPYISNEFQLERVRVNPEGRFLEFIFINKPLLPMYEALRELYSILQNNKQFIDLGNKKILITHIGGLVTNEEGYDEVVVVNLHRNVVLDNNTSFYQYHSKIKSVYATHYGFEIANLFYVKVWKAHHLQNKTIYRNTRTVELRNRIRDLGQRRYSTSYNINTI